MRSPSTRPCRAACSASAWIRINERVRRRRGPAAAKDRHPAGADAGHRGAGRRALYRILLDLPDPDRGGAGDGHDDLHHGFGPDPRLRHDGRAQLWPRRLHRARRLCRDARLAAAGDLVERGFGRAQPRCLRPRRAGGGADQRRPRLGVRAPHRQAGLWRAPPPDPGDDRRLDHRRAAHLRPVRAGPDPARPAENASRLVRFRRGGGREIPGAGDAGRPRRVRRRNADPQPHQDRPPHPRRRGEPRDGRGAGLPHRSAVRRRVHGGLRPRRPRWGDDGALPRPGSRRDRGRVFGALLHRHRHRGPGLGRRLLRRLDPGCSDRQLRRLPRAEARPRLEHSGDGRRASLAPARALPGERAMMLLSGDPPRGRALQIIIALIVAALALSPFLFPGAKALNTAAKSCVMILLVASYDVLIGYTGIVSFSHVMFFGVGAYGVGLALYGLGATWGALIAGVLIAFALSLALALAIGLFSLRVQSIFFAMVTLAVAYAFNVLASQLSWLTGGEDGRSFKVPLALQPGFKWLDHPILGVQANGKLLAYYLVFAVVVVGFLLLLRVVNSPFGRVLQAIRENPFRAEALGYRTVFHRTLATCISALGATLAGALSALWLRYVGPDTALSFSIQVDVLVMVVVGGMGSLYGAILGAALFVFAESYLQDVMGALSHLAADARLPLLPALFHPDRWLLWLGLAFVLAVYFAPLGIVGALKAAEGKGKQAARGSFGSG